MWRSEADKLHSIAAVCPLRELSLLKAEVEDKKNFAISYYKTIEKSLFFYIPDGVLTVRRNVEPQTIKHWLENKKNNYLNIVLKATPEKKYYKDCLYVCSALGKSDCVARTGN